MSCVAGERAGIEPPLDLVSGRVAGSLLGGCKSTMWPTLLMNSSLPTTRTLSMQLKSIVWNCQKFSSDILS